jgi:cyclopropane-fatty-acyl-phospholipid synthase
MVANAADFRLVFRTNRAKARIALFRHIGLLESYFDGDVDLEGDLRAALREAMLQRRERPNWLVAARNHIHEWRYSNRTWEQARINARFHYGLGTDFYKLWLDRDLLMYTCGYWKEGTRTVEEAQRNKVEHVCRKVCLQPGESVIDVGTGFGGFMFHAHEHHGVQCVGLNTTPEQNVWVREEIARRGLGKSLSVVETDFRDTFREFDKVVSIGVLEHAGRDQLREVVAAHARFLKPGGLGLLHFIGHVGVRPTEYFIREFVFPGGWIPSLAEVIVAMEDAGLEVIDIENLRRHYAHTLDAWAERFDANWPQIHAIDPKKFDERFRRIWRTYLLGCAEMFRLPNGRTHLFQILFSRGNVTWSNFPHSRAYMYAENPGPSRNSAAVRAVGGSGE